MVGATIARMDHPWRRLRELAEWTLEWAHLPGDVVGLTDWTRHTITLDRGLLQAERRSVLAHELEHVAREVAPLDPVLRAREESAVDQAAARRLIPLDRLADALAWSHCHDEAADELWVSPELLRVRLAHLHPAELAVLRRHLQP